MNSIYDDKKSQALDLKNQKPPAEIEVYIKDFRDKGILALADMSEDEQTNFANWAKDVVDRYGSILQEYSAKIKNIADLPCPKEDLKIVIKALLPAYLAKGSDDIVNLLKDRYIRLSAFQEISQKDKENIIKESNEIDQKSGSTDNSLFSKYQKYMQLIISEQKILLEDINTFIDDVQIQKRDS